MMEAQYLESIGYEPGRQLLEAQVLACMMIEPEWVGLCDLAEVDFADSIHRRIYQTIAEIHADGGDTGSVEIWKRDREISPSSISKILNTVPTAHNFKTYLRDLKREIVEQTKKSAALEMATSVRAGDDHEEAMSRMKDKIGQAERRLQPNDESPSFKRAVEVILRRIEQREQALDVVWTGIGWLDEISRGLIPGDYIILAARPSCGKTALVVQILAEIANNCQRSIFFSKEMGHEGIGQRLIQYVSWLDVSGLLRGAQDEEARAEVLASSPSVLSVCDQIEVVTSGINTPEAIERKSREAVARGSRVIAFDYLQLMEGQGRDKNRNAEIERFSRRMKALCHELKVPGIFLSQLSRSCESEGRRPRLSDLRDSGSIEQDADLVWFLHKEKIDHKDKRQDAPECTVFLQAKGRNVGLGWRRLKFDGRSQRFAELSRDANP